MNGYFQYAVNFTLRPENEGGYVNDPDDPGGATKFGVTQRTLDAWLYSKGLATYDVAVLTTQTAGDILFDLYWKPYRLDQVTRIGPAIAVFDAGVLFGSVTAILQAQNALAALGCTTIKCDGVIGPETLAVLNAVGPGTFLSTYVAWLKLHIADIVHKKPVLDKFKNGWSARVSRYLTLS